MTSINDANSTYANALKQIQNGNIGKSTEKAGESSDFGAMVQESLNSVIDAQKKSEQVSAAALTGEADITDVMMAINDAEVALNSVLAIRDKVIQAYEEVIRTPI